MQSCYAAATLSTFSCVLTAILFHAFISTVAIIISAIVSSLKNAFAALYVASLTPCWLINVTSSVSASIAFSSGVNKFVSRHALSRKIRCCVSPSANPSCVCMFMQKAQELTCEALILIRCFWMGDKVVLFSVTDRWYIALYACGNVFSMFTLCSMLFVFLMEQS